MNRATFHNSFRAACSTFKENECIKFISESNTDSETVTFAKLESMIDEIILKYKSMMIVGNQCIGIVCNDLDLHSIAIMIGLTEVQASFVFVDRTWNFEKTVNRLNVKFFVCHESLVDKCSPLNVIVDDDLSTTVFFKNYKILKRNSFEYIQFKLDPDTAFIAFSSGTTGDPKSIQIPFRSIIPNIVDLRNIYQLQPFDTIYVTTPPTFDPCILDIFLALSCGCRLLLVATNLKFDERILSNIFSDLATVCCITPSVFLKTFPKRMTSTTLRILTFGGESFPNLDSVLYPCLEQVKVYNIYGITEVSCWASIDLVTDRKDSSLGVPLSDTIFEVRDLDGRVINEGVGELFIGSCDRICILQDDESSLDEKPYFRSTGDIVEVKGSKHFYVGRTDRRVKIFGHRVDLASIDRILSSLSSVKQCYTIFLQEENIIVIFVILSSNEMTVENMETFLKQHFSPTVLPSKIFIIPELPLNKHGKVCRRACEQLYYSERSLQKTDYVLDFEILWKKYTSRDVNEDLGFIESGGNSFLALQFTSALESVSRVSNNFIVSLLSNEKYSHCLELLSPLNDTESIETSIHKPKRYLNEIEDNELKSRKKKMRFNDSFGRLKSLLCRGEIRRIVNFERYSTSSEILSNNMKLKWKHDMGKCVDASPTVLVYENTSIVVCGSHSGRILIIDVNSGDILTSLMLPDRIESSACPSSCGKYIFVGCYDHKVYCIEVQTGSIKWSFDTEDMVKSSPVYFDKKLFFGSYDHYFYCISQEGQLQWRIEVDKSSIYASAAIDGNKIIVTTLGGTIAFLNHNGQMNAGICFEKPFFSSPCMIESNMVVTIDVTGVVRLLDTISSEQIWQYQADGNVFSSISHFKTGSSNEFGRIIFGCHDKRVYCLDISAKEATLCWRLNVPSPVYATPFCFENGDSPLVCVANTTGNILIIDANDSTVVKYCSMESDIFSSPVIVGATAIFGCRNNYLYALDIS